jgi:proteasome lid subunit RPN8/RPN11
MRAAPGSPLRAIYHSHPDHDAYFSATDSAAAALWGEPNYPGVVYLVYSVKRGRFAAAKAFDWSEGKREFIEISLAIR